MNKLAVACSFVVLTAPLLFSPASTYANQDDVEKQITSQLKMLESAHDTLAETYQIMKTEQLQTDGAQNNDDNSSAKTSYYLPETPKLDTFFEEIKNLHSLLKTQSENILATAKNEGMNACVNELNQKYAPEFAAFDNSVAGIAAFTDERYGKSENFIADLEREYLNRGLNVLDTYMKVVVLNCGVEAQNQGI